MKIFKFVYVSLGAVSLAAGVIGVVLPVVPTTPFVLLSLYFFAKGSERLSDWLKGTRFYEIHIKEYAEQRALPRKKKLAIHVFASSMMLMAFFSVSRLEPKVLLVALLLIQNYYFIFKIPTIEENAPKCLRACLISLFRRLFG